MKTIKVEYVLHAEKAEALIRVGSRTRSLAWVRAVAMKLAAQTEPSSGASQPLEPAPCKPSVTIGDHVRRRPVWLFPALTLTLIAVGQEALFRSLFPFPEVAGFNRISYQMTAQG